MITLRQFNDLTARLHCLDYEDLVRCEALPEADGNNLHKWHEFRANPVSWLRRAETAKAEAVWALATRKPLW